MFKVKKKHIGLSIIAICGTATFLSFQNFIINPDFVSYSRQCPVGTDYYAGPSNVCGGAGTCYAAKTDFLREHPAITVQNIGLNGNTVTEGYPLADGAHIMANPGAWSNFYYQCPLKNPNGSPNFEKADLTYACPAGTGAWTRAEADAYYANGGKEGVNNWGTGCPDVTCWRKKWNNNVTFPYRITNGTTTKMGKLVPSNNFEFSYVQCAGKSVDTNGIIYYDNDNLLVEASSTNSQGYYTGPMTISKITNNHVTVAPGTPITSTFTMVDDRGIPAKNAKIEWAITAGAGSLSEKFTVTDSNGQTTITFTPSSAYHPDTYNQVTWAQPVDGKPGVYSYVVLPLFQGAQPFNNTNADWTLQVNVDLNH